MGSPGPSWCLLGPSWGHLGPSGVILKPYWDHLGSTLNVVGLKSQSAPKLQENHRKTRIFRAYLGHLVPISGSTWSHFGLSWGHLEAILGHPGAILEPSWADPAPFSCETRIEFWCPRRRQTPFSETCLTMERKATQETLFVLFACFALLA